MAVGVLQILLVPGVFGAFGRALWTVSKEIQSRKNVKSSSPDFGEEATSNPAIGNESVPEKSFKNFVIIFLMVLVVVIGLLALVSLWVALNPEGFNWL